VTESTTTTTKPIDARQHTWWHRLRRLGPWGFTILGGGLAAPLLTCSLFAGVVWFFRYPPSTFFTNGALIWLVSSPVYLGSCFWTWKHMEKRYHATLATRCPVCGYSREGNAGDGPCPECGN
jgi:hypothetical protein